MTTKNETIYQRLCEVLPAGVNSPVRSFKGLDMPPMVVRSGKGDSITDADGNVFIDYCLSWGPLVHGHAHPDILGPVQKRIQMGTSFGITTEIEEMLARKIVQSVPSVELIRFVSSGTEATMSAARVARGYTGRDIIVKFAGNYHGHADFFLIQAGSGVLNLSQTSSSAGIPNAMVQHMFCLPYNDPQAIIDLFAKSDYQGKIAAVILEPIAANMGVVPADRSFIQTLREQTKKNGALLIFDEVVTGFRLGMGGAQEYYGVEPDMTCFGKIIGGGFPAAAFGGRKAVMESLAPLGPVYQAGTLSGNPVAMEAGLQTLLLLEKKGVFAELERKANVITKPVQEWILKRKANACVQQVGSMFTLFFGKKSVKNLDDARGLDLNLFARYFRFMYDHGVYLPPSQHEAWFVSTVHEEKHLEKTRDLTLQFLEQAL